MSNENALKLLIKSAEAAIAYDRAIQGCADDPDKMSSYCTAQGDDLDTLYFNWIQAARAALIAVKISPAAANKSAEEGELPALPEPMFKSVANGGIFARDGYDALQVFEYTRAAIAADRESRQVANKAEVERPQYEELNEHLRQFQHNDGSGLVFGYDKAGIDRMMARLLAAPPATTGASTAPLNLDAYDAGSLSDFGGGDVNWWQDYIRAELERAHDFYQSQIEGSAPASTVLTDERIDAAMLKYSTFVTPGAYSLTSFECVEDMRNFAREVAAQAGQVAVPEWISVDERLPDAGHCLATYRNQHGKLRIIRAKYARQFEIDAGEDAIDQGNCEYNEADDTFYLKAGWLECIDNWDDYSSIYVTEGEVTHWMPLPAAPSPAKESK